MEVPSGLGNVVEAGTVADGTCVRQSFFARGSNLSLILVYLAYRSRSIQEFFFIDILDFITRKKVGGCCVEGIKLEDEGWCEFAVDVNLIVGKKYDMVLRTLNVRAGFCPTAYCGLKTGGGDLFMGSSLIRGMELKCRFEYAVQVGGSTR